MRRRTPKEGKAEECWVREGEEKKERDERERGENERMRDGAWMGAKAGLELEGP